LFYENYYYYLINY